MEPMARYLLEVRLPDRPGALGAVASRIGAVGGDIVAVDIVTRGGEHAVDEFVVELPGDDLVSLLLHEVHEVDGVDVVEIRPLPAAEEPRV
jgi:UTP:GlnB (protein PII) uridylyltransferase